MLADVENPEDPGAAAFDENAAATVTRPSTADTAGDEATALLESTITEPRRNNNSPPLSTRTHHSDECNNNHIITVTDLDEYVGESLHDKVDDLIKKHAVVMFGNARQSIFSMDAKELLGTKIGVDVHSIDLDVHPKGGEIFQCVALQNNNKNVSTLPLIYIKGKFVGGYEDIKALHAKGQLENVYLKGLIVPSSAESNSPRQRQERLDASNMDPDTEPSRRAIMSPPFWFPNTVNHYVMRGVGFQVLVLSVLSVAFHFKSWGRYLAVALLVDFGLRFVAGPSMSILGMMATLATCKYIPDFRPGPPQQFASLSGAFLAIMAVIFFFVDFKGHEIVGAIWMALLAIVAGVETFLDHSLGCVLFDYGIKVGLIPDSVNLIHTATRQETIDTWNYNFQDSNAPVPVRVNTNPKSSISLTYKRKTEEWTKDDFDPIRHMQVLHFAMPLAISGLAVAFKIASDWSEPYGQASIRLPRSTIAPDVWFQVLSFIGAFIFVFFFLLYSTRMYMFPKKCWKDWHCPLRSSGFGMLPVVVMFYAFLIYDEINKREPGGDEENSQTFASVLWWIGSVSHTILTVAKTGEWIGRRMELEHVHPHWMIFPIGLSVAAFVAPVVGVFSDDNERAGGNAVLAQFFHSFAWLMWVTLFGLTFFKVVTQHNTDDRLRHGVFLWLATPCTLGLAEYVICYSSNVLDHNTCEVAFAEKFFIGIFLFMSFVFATFPPSNFFGRASFDMGYWIECFALDTLAASASLFYALNGWQISQTLQSIGLVVASVANAVCFLHTATACVLQHGVFTPDVKWNPLSFIKLTHEAFRCNIETLRQLIDKVDVEDESAEAKEMTAPFAAHLARFFIVYEEHAKYEVLVVFKTCNDYFPKHTRRYYEDHSQDTPMNHKWRKLANVIADTKRTIEERKSALGELKSGLPDFFTRFEKHIKDEDENLEPIARKYLPLEITKQVSRDVWKITNKWEIIIPFVVMSLPRHGSRVRYLKVLCWSMPERAQQIGAILYRHMDVVMWERLRFEIPEIIPRGAIAWKRYS